MAPAGHPFLWLILSTLLISTTTSANQNQPQEQSTEKLKHATELLKTASKNILKEIEKISSVVSPVLEIFSVTGLGLNIPKLIFSVAALGSSLVNKNNDLEPLMNEFENLNFKLDQYHAEQKWDIWKSEYHKQERDIKVAWTTFTTLLQTLKQTKDTNEQKKHKEEFKRAYEMYEPATKKIHTMLVADGNTFILPLGHLVAESSKCHEKIIRQYTVLIHQLLYKGNLMNNFYYELKNIKSEARVDEECDITYDTNLAMFQIHKLCINNSMDYIKKDVTALIDKTKKRSELANEVWSFLVEVYDKYDWMVVAFIAKKSSHETFKFLNKHTLSGFTEVTKGGVSVAVARQVKGTHTKAALVKQTIGRCIDESVWCSDVAKNLKECSETVKGIRVSQTYTAVHAYRKHADDSQYLQEVNGAPEDSQDNYIYRGKCRKTVVMKGKFVVLIKSDGEIMIKDPCLNLDCGGNERGTCVRFNDIFLVGCQCKKPYYGENCEKSLDDYRKNLMADLSDDTNKISE